jgi:hypothetical protein
VNNEDQLEIERLGGLAGIGLAGSRIRSRATLRAGDLTADERDAMARLFSASAHAPRPAAGSADGFHYRLTLRDRTGVHVIEADPGQVPESLQAKVKDELI